MKEIKVYEFEFVDAHSDAGTNGIAIKCPECNSKVIFAEYSWWDTKCECGYEWQLDVICTGIKEE